MSTETILQPPLALPPPEDPFFYGWRYVKHTDEHGKETWKQVGLTAWDVLHPEEGDFVVHTPAHDRDCAYLRDIFQDLLRDRPNTLVFHDMRIDWQAGDYSIFGPDIVVFENVDEPFPMTRDTFPVEEWGARTVLVVEVISPSTQSIDRKTKVSEYHRMRIPLYVVVDRDGESVSVTGYRWARAGYKQIPDDGNGVWVEFLQVWIRAAGDRVACFDKRGKRIPEMNEQRDAERERARSEAKARRQAAKRAEQEKQRADLQEQRAETENQRAEEERRRRELQEERAEQEKQRADENARKLAELEAEIRRLRGEAN